MRELLGEKNVSLCVCTLADLYQPTSCGEKQIKKHKYLVEVFGFSELKSSLSLSAKKKDTDIFSATIQQKTERCLNLSTQFNHLNYTQKLPILFCINVAVIR